MRYFFALLYTIGGILIIANGAWQGIFVFLYVAYLLIGDGSKMIIY